MEIIKLSESQRRILSEAVESGELDLSIVEGWGLRELSDEEIDKEIIRLEKCRHNNIVLCKMRLDAGICEYKNIVG